MVSILDLLRCLSSIMGRAVKAESMAATDVVAGSGSGDQRASGWLASDNIRGRGREERPMAGSGSGECGPRSPSVRADRFEPSSRWVSMSIEGGRISQVGRVTARSRLPDKTARTRTCKCEPAACNVGRRHWTADMTCPYWQTHSVVRISTNLHTYSLHLPLRLLMMSLT